MGVSVAVVGCGQFANGFIGLFRDHPLVGKVVLCDTREDRLQTALECFSLKEGYRSFDAVCASDVDAVVVMTQPWLHAPQCIQAMESGKHAWSAVPLISLPDGGEMLDWCDRIVETSRRTGIHYFLAETSWYHPSTMFCRRKVAEGVFGELVHADVKYAHDYNWPGNSHLVEIAKRRWGSQWDMSKSGSTPMHYPTHSLGGILGVVDARVTKVSCIGHVHRGDEWFRPDTIYANPFSNQVALAQLSNGMTVRFAELRRTGSRNFEGIEQLVGTEAHFAQIERSRAAWTLRHTDEPELLPLNKMRDPLPAEVLSALKEGGDASAYGGHQGSHVYLVHEFVDAIANNRAPVIDACRAAALLAPGVIAHKSAQRDGEWLDVPNWCDEPGEALQANEPIEDRRIQF